MGAHVHGTRRAGLAYTVAVVSAVELSVADAEAVLQDGVHRILGG